ncbi:MAG: hypothetical protein WDW38_009447 [Sanguina aurantia]
MKSQLSVVSLAVRQEHMALMRQLALELPSRFGDLTALLCEEQEVDVFVNVAHLQLHRRARALLKVKSLAEEAVQSCTTTTNAATANALTTTTTVTAAPATQQLTPAAAAAAQAVAVRGAMLTRVLLDIGVPILQQSIADASGHQGGRAHDLKQVDVDRQANVTDAAIQPRGLLLVFAFSLAWLTADAATLPMPIANSINATATGKPDGPAPGWSIATSAPTGWTADCCKYAKAIGVDLVLYRGDWTGNPAQVMVLNVWPRKLPSLDAEVKADHAHYLKGDPRGSVSEFPVATKNLACRGVQYEGSDRIDEKLLLVALCTLALPVAGWLYVRQMESLLREGQAQALLAAARAVARSLVVTGVVLPEDAAGWYVQEATSPITVDGYGDDWAPLTPWSQPLGPAANPRGRLLLAQDSDWLYFFADVRDTKRTRADADDANALMADHLIVSLANAGGTQRYLLASAAPGGFTARRLDPPLAGFPMPLSVQWQENGSGYRVELRVPRSANIRALGVGAFDAAAGGDPMAVDVRPLLAYSVRLSSELARLAPDDVQARVLAPQGWLLARSGKLHTEPGTDGQPGWFASMIYRSLLGKQLADPALWSQDVPRLDTGEVALASRGKPSSVWRSGEQRGSVVLAAAVPVTQDGKVNGVLLLEQASRTVPLLANRALHTSNHTAPHHTTPQTTPHHTTPHHTTPHHILEPTTIPPPPSAAACTATSCPWPAAPRNPTATPHDMLSFIYATLDDCLEREEAAREHAEAIVGAAGLIEAATQAAQALLSVPQQPLDLFLCDGVFDVTPVWLMLTGSRGAAELAQQQLDDKAMLHEYLLVEFVLTLLQAGIRKGSLVGRSPELLGMLDPLLPLLVRGHALQTLHTPLSGNDTSSYTAPECQSHAGSAILALKVLSFLVHLPLPSLPTAAQGAGKAVSILLKKVPGVTHPIAQEAFKLLSGLLRHCDAYKPSAGTLRYLLTWAFADLGEAADRPAAFSLLRAVLARRLVLPEVYDVMSKVQEVMVRSQSTPVRQLCSSTLLQFLLDYPLGPKRLQQHMSFLIANLAYEHESGRLQVLDLLVQVISKFPLEVVQANADILLLPLVTRLVNDSSSPARTLVGAVLKSLLGKLLPQQLDDLAGYCREWLSKGAPAAGAAAGQLRRAAAQTLGLMVEVEGGRFGRRLQTLGEPVLQVLRSAAAASEATEAAVAAGGGGDADGADGSSCPGWQEAYACLLMLEKLAAQQQSGAGLLTWNSNAAPADGGGSSRQRGNGVSAVAEIWEAVIRLLLHRHLWVRKAASRLLGAGLGAGAVSEGLYLKPSRAGELAFSLFLQLENEAADDAMCLQAAKCLVGLLDRLQLQYAQQVRAYQESHGIAGGSSADGGGSSGTGNGSSTPAGAARRSRQSAKAPVQEGGEGDDVEVTEGGGSDQGDAESDLEGSGGGSDASEDSRGEGDGQEPADGTGGGTKRRRGGDGPDAGAAAAAVVDAEGAGDEGAEGDEDADEDGGDDVAGDVAMGQQYQHQAFTLRGLIRRMARLADDGRYTCRKQRATALKWIAAAGSKLGAAAVTPHLPVLLRPLYRITEAGQAAQMAEDVRTLASEVMAHLRVLVGADVLLAAYNTARSVVKAGRTERKKRRVLQTMLDPVANAAARIKRGVKKARARRRTMEEEKRTRSARTFSSSGKKSRGGGRGGGGGGRGDSGGGRGGGGRGSGGGGSGRGGGEAGAEALAGDVKTAQQLAELVLETVEVLGLQGCYCFGHSIGGSMAVLMELTRPGTFKAIFCFEPILLPHNFSKPREPQQQHSQPSPAASHSPGSTGGVVLCASPRSEARNYALLDPVPTPDTSSLGCPVTIAVGQANAGVHAFAATFGGELARVIPRCKLVRCDTLNHLGPMEDPPLVAGHVLQAFLLVSQQHTTASAGLTPSKL